MSSELISSGSEGQNNSLVPIWHQLLNRTIKPFRPELDLKDQTIHTYICDQCCDEFLHESSLSGHLQRRSLVVSYFCDQCNQKVSFFNRCALLSHIKSHLCDDSHITDTLSKVLIQPIDLKQLLVKKTSLISKGNEPNVTQINDHKNRSLTSDDKSLTIASSLRPSNETKSSEKIIKAEKKTKNSIPNSDSCDTKYVIKKSTNSELKCCQCKCSFNSLWTREQHFSDRQLALPLNQCRLCPTICATNCSLSLHNKLHCGLDSSDQFCPECGTKVDANQLLFHTIVDCLHLSRRLLYVCMYCSEKLRSLPESVQHIKSFHTRQQFQCPECQYIFKDKCQFENHQTHSHSNSLEAIILLKCPVCGTEFNSVKDYSFHLTTHRKNFLDFTSFTFVCLECEQSFATKSDLKSHIDIDHLKDKTEVQKNEYSKHLTQEMAIKFKLKFNFSSENTSETKLKNNISLNNKKCLEETKEKICDSDLANKRIKLVDNKSKIDRNNSNCNANANDNWFECRECSLSFPFVQTLKRHLILEHRIHDVETYINTTYVKIPITQMAPQFPKEIGEEKLSKILNDVEHSDDTLCPICSQKFTDSKELKIHGRVHGLAFIKSCQKKIISFH